MHFTVDIALGTRTCHLCGAKIKKGVKFLKMAWVSWSGGIEKYRNICKTCSIKELTEERKRIDGMGKDLNIDWDD